jgi:hypothetical protein
MAKNKPKKKLPKNGNKKNTRRSPAIKVSDEQFFAILRENAGLFSRTARAISTQFGIKYSRQSVHERARKHPEILADIDEENLDIAEEGLNSIMRSKSETIRLDAVKFYLKNKGKKRGYVEKTETAITVKKLGKTLEDEQYT